MPTDAASSVIPRKTILRMRTPPGLKRIVSFHRTPEVSRLRRFCLVRRGFANVLFDNASRILVFSKPDKLRMPQPVRFRPFQKFYLGDGLRAKPDAFLHFFGSEFITPTRLVRVRQVSKGHRWGYERADFLEDLAT